MYRDRISFPAGKYMAAAVGLGFGFGAFQELNRGEEWPASLLFGGAVAGVIAAACLLVWLLPVIGEGKPVTVNERGMRVAGRRLPAEAIGRARRVRDPGLRGFGFLRSVDGEKVPWTRCFIHGGSDFAVLVEDLRDVRRGRRRRHWLIQPQDPRRLIAALRQAARDAH